ncbi:hypothetical protein [Paenibacillus oleatilyticus]|uniref:hypothetical protein n=1 Tax=Paenibacillus oleatilyticus TaxID=2594886 RepID=UPI001C1FED0D|nr:hypothetical protein [Paenibacillus oleatilyticus]MBU7315972.1 hypothetical protein [Paenibacillus oleatilyticus]
MGVRSHNFILIGCNIGSEYYNDEEWEKEDSLYTKYDFNRKSKSGDIVILDDVYSQKYFIVGEIIQIDYDCEGSGLEMTVIDESTEQFKKAAQRVKSFILDTYNLDVEPKYIVLTHHT